MLVSKSQSLQLIVYQFVLLPLVYYTMLRNWYMYFLYIIEIVRKNVQPLNTNLWFYVSIFGQTGLNQQCSPSSDQALRLWNFLLCSIQLGTRFILLKNVKVPIIFGILTFISGINSPSNSFKARKIFCFHHFTFYGQLKFQAELSWALNSLYPRGLAPRL